LLPSRSLLFRRAIIVKINDLVLSSTVVPPTTLFGTGVHLYATRRGNHFTRLGECSQCTNKAKQAKPNKVICTSSTSWITQRFTIPPQPTQWPTIQDINSNHTLRILRRVRPLLQIMLASLRSTRSSTEHRTQMHYRKDLDKIQLATDRPM
jgi:hypothetical protein